jgi:hypothetical protein
MCGDIGCGHDVKKDGYHYAANANFGRHLK